MTEGRKKAWRSWVLKSLLVGLMAYPLSFGPICWIASRTTTDNRDIDWMRALYRPLFWVADRSPKPVQDLVMKYGNCNGRKIVWNYHYYGPGLCIWINVTTRVEATLP